MKRSKDRCPTCLSSGRRLIPVSQIKCELREMKVDQLKNVKTICWECHRIVMKFYLFTRQAREAQTKLNKKAKNIKSLSRLSYSRKNGYDYELTYNPDALVNEKTYINEETDFNYESDIKIEIKQEEVLIEQSDYDSDEKLDSSDQDICKIYIKREQAKTQPVKEITVKERFDTDFSEKYETVLYTEEEMLKNREEKRSHPNYKKIPFKCDNCVLGFTRRDYFEAHVEKKHSEAIGTYVCSVCTTRFATSRNLEKHREKHFLHYKCNLCMYVTPNLKTVQNHCKDKHENDDKGRIHCKQCDAVLRTPEELLTHNTKEHSLVCDECGERFSGKKTLKKHLIRMHSAKRKFICDECKKTFNTRSRLESHIITHSATLAQRLSYCDRCDRQFKDIHTYKNHVRYNVNHARSSAPCPVCKKRFCSKVYLKKHYNFYHLNKSRFKCESCDKLFISEWLLKNHRQKHHGLLRTRDHSCNICNKKFYTTTTLKSHMLTHSERRLFMCDECGDTFKQIASLYTHNKLLHKNAARNEKYGTLKKLKKK